MLTVGDALAKALAKSQKNGFRCFFFLANYWRCYKMTFNIQFLITFFGVVIRK